MNDNSKATLLQSITNVMNNSMVIYYLLYVRQDIEPETMPDEEAIKFLNNKPMFGKLHVKFSRVILAPATYRC